MVFIRNNIEIEGVEQRDGVQDGSFVLNYWENGPIFLPKSKGKIRNLNKVIIEMDSIEGRILNTPSGKVLSIYGRKIYSLIYSEKSHDRSQKTVIDLPFVAYAYLPVGVDDVIDLEVSILDAFFEVIDNRKVHNHILYLIKFNKKEINKPHEVKDVDENFKGNLTLMDIERMITKSQINNTLISSVGENIRELEGCDIKLLQSGEGAFVENEDNNKIINNFSRDDE